MPSVTASSDQSNQSSFARAGVNAFQFGFPAVLFLVTHTVKFSKGPLLPDLAREASAEVTTQRGRVASNKTISN